MDKAALLLRQLRVSSTGEPGDGKRQRVGDVTADELVEQARRFLRERVPFVTQWIKIKVKQQLRVKQQLKIKQIKISPI